MKGSDLHLFWWVILERPWKSGAPPNQQDARPRDDHVGRDESGGEALSELLRCPHPKRIDLVDGVPEAALRQVPHRNSVPVQSALSTEFLQPVQENSID